MHEDSMKMLQGDCASWLIFLTGIICGQGLPGMD